MKGEAFGRLLACGAAMAAGALLPCCRGLASVGCEVRPVVGLAALLLGSLLPPLSEVVGRVFPDEAPTLIGLFGGADALLCSALAAVLGRSVRGEAAEASPATEGAGVRGEGVMRATPRLGGFTREGPAPDPGTMLAAFGVEGLKLTGYWPAT